MSDLLDRIRTWVNELSPRERLAVLAAGGLLALVIVVFGVVGPVLSAAGRAEARAEAAEQELATMVRLRREYDEVNGRLRTVEQRIESGPQGNIFTTLESLAKQSAVTVDSMEPQPSPASDRYRETKVQLVLKGLTLAQLVNYLHKIESADQLLSVKSLRIRTRSDDSEKLDATFTVSSFERI